jgi:uncharacterized membrane protein YdjX (TVP38/TMEM64 family)
MSLRESLRRHRGKLAILLLLAAAVVWFAQAHRAGLTREKLLAYGEALPAGAFLAAFLLLPLAGFPLSIFLVLAGIRFGLGGGMAVAALAVTCHHFATFRLAHGWFRDPVRRRLARAGHAIPPVPARHRAWFTALFAAVHGPPYIAKLYLLALTDVPFRIYLGVGAPIYILFCLIPVGAGSALIDFNPTWLYLLLALSTVLLLAGYGLRRHLARRFR